MKAKGAQLAVVPLSLLQAEVPTKAAPPKLQAQIVAAVAAGQRCERAVPPVKPPPVLPALPIQAAATARLESGVSPLPWLEPSMQHAATAGAGGSAGGCDRAISRSEDW